MSTAADVSRPRFRPWHSALLGWLVTGLVLFFIVPIFLCMPPWNDVTLHDLAVRAILRGGVHYRDIFDTNLPGIDWAMAVVRSLFGWSYEVLRAVDLLVMAAITAFLLAWVRRAGGASYTIAWLAAAIALFYPFSTEFNHMQRDPWLLLPAIAASSMRLARVRRGFANHQPAPALGETPVSTFPAPENFWRTVGEGFVWGLAVWVKPHVLIPAASIWGLSVILLTRRENARRICVDFARLLFGGLVAGAAGVSWMFATGAWPYFLDVFLNWNPSYLSDVWPSTLPRFFRTFYCFRPWSILHVPALLLAIVALWEARAWSRRPGGPGRVWGAGWIYTPAGSELIASARALFASFYLAWFAQATFLQKGLDYVQVPLLLLAMGMVATQRWTFGFAYLVWFVLLSLLTNFQPLAPVSRVLEPLLSEARSYQDPFCDLRLLKLWPRCWREGSTPELRDRTGQYIDIHCGTNWEDLDRVAQYLRRVNPPLGPGELNCWHDSTHPLYLILNLEPATRYMHYGTALGIRSKKDAIAAEVAASHQRYVVSDLLRMCWSLEDAYAPGTGGDPHRLPRWFPVSQRDSFPWNQPIVFRSGRYLVHKVEKPLGVIDIPDWSRLDELGPGE